MPVSNFTLMRATALFTLVGLAALLAMVGLSFWMLERTRNSTEEVLAMREMRSALADLFSLMQDAETGQRGYLITGEERYLQPYDDAVIAVEAGIKKVEGVARRQQEPGDFIAKLRPTIADKLAELKKTVDLKRARKSDEAHRPDAYRLVVRGPSLVAGELKSVLGSAADVLR